MTTLRLTYEELAERIGRSPEGARMLARRQQRQGRWRIDRGNDGKARVVVEEENLVAQPTGQPPGRPSGRAPDERAPDHPTVQVDVELVAELRTRVRALEVEREALIEAGDHLVDQMGEARERAARVEGELAAVREMSQLEAAALREVHQRELATLNEVSQRQAEVLREALGDLAGRLDRATDELRDLRRPWWRRLFA